MAKRSVRIVIPDKVDFASLKLSRDPSTGAVSFDWHPIDEICRASGLDQALFRDQEEGNVAGLIVAWYTEHRTQGGAPDPVAEELIAEVIAKDAWGGGLSHPPGRA